MKCPQVASCQICLDLECRHTSSRKLIASDMLVGSLGRFPPLCVFIALVASNAGLIYCLQGWLPGGRAEQPAAMLRPGPVGSKMG